jgi:hypothetical protein
VPGEESVRLVAGAFGDAGVPTHVGVQRSVVVHSAVMNSSPPVDIGDRSSTV